ncbi:hypothetical protein Hypma_010406 [Hypsizygus marmoreus]|uniref:Uncharacterized protein n=1 Tax=Hypsizygus marmoreus TaxID=39966 RepID=A0A369JPF6_HYPMA|nr:hypothetical protein Hypma_010406 [Hypsizygus marmoreus]
MGYANSYICLSGLRMTIVRCYDHPSPDPIAPLSLHFHHKSPSLSSVPGPHLHSLRWTTLSKPPSSVSLLNFDSAACFPTASSHG